MSNEDNVSIETPNNKERKKSKLLIPLTIVTIFIVLLGLFGGYYYLSSRPKKVVTNMINTLYNNYQTAYNNQNKINYNEKPVLIDGNFKINTNIPGFEDLEKEQINFQVGVDYKNKNLLSGFSLSEDNNKLIEIIYYIINNQMYLKFDEYDKLILANNEEGTINIDEIFKKNNTNISTEDTHYLITELKDILIDSFDEKDFKKDTDTIEINGKDTKVNKLTYKLSEENIKNLDERLTKNILKNEKLLEKISGLTNTSTEDLKKSLQKSNEEYENLGELNIYTTKLTNKLRMVEYSHEGTKFQIYFDENINKISIKMGLYSIDFDIITNTEEKVDIKYTINYGVIINGNITITSKKINDDKYEGTIDFKINYMNYSLGLTGNMNIETNDNIFDIDTTNAVDSKTLDQNTLTSIMENIMLKLQNSNLNKILEGLSENNNNSLM